MLTMGGDQSVTTAETPSATSDETTATQQCVVKRDGTMTEEQIMDAFREYHDSFAFLSFVLFCIVVSYFAYQ